MVLKATQMLLTLSKRQLHYVLVVVMQTRFFVDAYFTKQRNNSTVKMKFDFFVDFTLVIQKPSI